MTNRRAGDETPGSDDGVPGDPTPFPPFEVDSTERIYDSWWVGLRRDMLRLDDGTLQEHHVIEIGDAVCVLPIRTDGRVVMVGQYRHSHGLTHWEVPAGRLEDGEAPEDGAVRELREETGYRAARLVPMPGFYPTNGISAHYAHLYAALDCEPAYEQDLDPAERMIVGTFSPAETEAMLRSGTIRDGFSALALLYGRLLLENGRGG
ncbi:MAG: NUDIX hydrolase [Planctomycetota bacterium]